MRAPAAASAIEVQITVDGGDPQSATVGAEWRNVEILLPESSAIGRYHRVDLRMPEPGSAEIGEIQVGSVREDRLFGR